MAETLTGAAMIAQAIGNLDQRLREQLADSDEGANLVAHPNGGGLTLADAPAYEPTPAEIAASVTPVDYRYPELHILRYGTNTTPGTTDMLAAIENAIAVASEKGGGEAFLPAGTYRVTNNVTMQSEVVLSGEGRGTVIQNLDTGAVLIECISVDSVTIRDLCLVGSPAQATQAGISCNGMTRSMIHNVYVTGVGHDGILLLTDCIGNTVSDCHVTGTGDDGINIGGGSGTSDNTVIGNIVEGCAHDGIHVSVGSLRTTVIGNVVMGCDVGIGIIDAGTASIIGNTIEGCTTASIRHFSANDQAHFAIHGNQTLGATSGILVRKAMHVSVMGNVVKDAVTTGIDVTHDTDFTDLDVSVVGNVVDGGCTSRGIAISDAEGVTVVGNTVTDITGIGIYANAATARIVISQNIIRGTGTHGIFVDDSLTSEHIVITGNVVDAPVGVTARGIYYLGGPYFTIANNHVRDAGDNGIYLLGSAPKNGRGRVEGNTVEGGCTDFGILFANYDDVICRSNIVFGLTSLNGIRVTSGRVLVEGNLSDGTISVTADGLIGVIASAAPAGTTPGTVTNKVRVIDKAGASIGYVAVYDDVT